MACDLNRMFDIINIVPFNINKIELDSNITKFFLPLYSPNSSHVISFVSCSLNCFKYVYIYYISVFIYLV